MSILFFILSYYGFLNTLSYMPLAYQERLPEKTYWVGKFHRCLLERSAQAFFAGGLCALRDRI